MEVYETRIEKKTEANECRDVIACIPVKVWYSGALVMMVVGVSMIAIVVSYVK